MSEKKNTGSVVIQLDAGECMPSVDRALVRHAILSFILILIVRKYCILENQTNYKILPSFVLIYKHRQLN